MDLNMLQEIGSQIAPIARDTIPELLTAFITTMFLNKNVQSKEYLNKLKNKKFFEVAENLLENGHITYLEFYKCNNFLKIAKLADKYKKASTKEENGANFDFDWFIRFFEASGNISNEQMQELWARVLAGEVNRPGTFSLRTIETLNNLTHKEAIAFSEIANLAMHTSDGMWFVVSEGSSAFNLDEVTDLIIPNNKIRLLQECGLLNPLKDDMLVWYSTREIISPLNIDENFIVSNDKIILLFHARDFAKRLQKKIKKAQSIFFPYYPLTEAGRQLLKIINNESEYNPILNLGEAINNHSKSSIRYVTAHEINKIEGNLVFYDPENLLC